MEILLDCEVEKRMLNIDQKIDTKLKTQPNDPKPKKVVQVCIQEASSADKTKETSSDESSSTPSESLDESPKQ